MVAIFTIRYQPQQQERDQRDGDLNAHRILGGPDEALDLQALLDPAEEQLDLPAFHPDQQKDALRASGTCPSAARRSEQSGLRDR
jgi:hypothetical protein